MAGKVADHVRDLGFERGTVDNTGPVEQSAVRYTGADEDAAEKLAEQLGGIDGGERRVGHPWAPDGHCWAPTSTRTGCRSWPGPWVGRLPTDPSNITAAGVPCVD